MSASPQHRHDGPRHKNAGAHDAHISAAIIDEMRVICAEACRQNLLSGCNGNASCRPVGRASDAAITTGTGDANASNDADELSLVYVTRSGAAKGRLTADDVCCMDTASGATLCGGPASSETPMHLAIYRAVPSCRAILHTHPRRLLALSLVLEDNLEDFLRLPLYEADTWRARLGFAQALPPGGPELAEAVAEVAQKHPAIWMRGHGLCCLGQSLSEALCLAEELEHLAAVQLLSLRAS